MNKRSILIVLLVMLFGSYTYAQMNISGKVTDDSGFGVSDASVMVKDTDNEVLTNEDGNYQITVNQDQAVNGIVTLVVDDGFTKSTQTVNYEDGLSLTQDLQTAQVVELEQAVAVGYGTVKKEDLTGAVDLLTEEDFNQGNNLTPENLIQGRSAGVQITTDGAAGGGSAIRIRGGSTLNGSNEPLVVIDGLPIENQNVGGGRSLLSSINPNDIESFSVLKDASATAIYGARGSNGVIIITTKKGKKKLGVNYSFNLAYKTQDEFIDVLSGNEYRNLVTQLTNDGTINFGQNYSDRIGNANTNWQDVIFNNTVQQQHNLSLTGNLFNQLPVRLSVGHNIAPEVLETEKFQRTTLSLALNPSFFDKHLNFNLNANYSLEDNRFADRGQIGGALFYNPTVPVFSSAGNYFQFLAPNGTNLAENAPRNPLSALHHVHNTGQVDRFFGSAELDYKLHFFPDLRAKVFVGMDSRRGEGSIRTEGNFPVVEGRERDRNSSSYSDQLDTENFTASLIYTKSIGDLDLDLTLGYDYQSTEVERFTTNNRNDPTVEPETTTPVDVVILSYLARLNLNFKDKYLLTLNYNRNGSSRFGSANKFGNFPGAAFAWKISKENFLKDSHFVSNLKLRLGWGITGNQEFNVGNTLNLYQSSITNSFVQGGYLFNGVPITTALPSGQNQEIRWEETTQYNAGIDYGIFGGKIKGAIDFWYKDITELFNFAPVADGANFTNQIIQNVGDMEIKGVDFFIESDIIKKQNFKWNLAYNFGIFQREVTKLPAGAIITGGGIGANPATITAVGETPGSFYTYQQLYDNNGNPIDGAFVDLNGDGQITSLDRYISANPDPDIAMGLLSNITYGKFDLSFNLRAQFGAEVINQVNASNAYINNLNNVGFPRNIPSSAVATNFLTANSEKAQSDYFVEDGSFLRMDNVTLGYTFDNVMSSESGKLRLTFGIQNAFLITDYSGLDPEVGLGGIDNTIYPRSRTFLFGANLSF